MRTSHCIVALSVLLIASVSADFYTPAVDRGTLNANLYAGVQTGTQFVTTLSSNVAGTVSATNPVAIHVTAAYKYYLHTLQINITHAGITVPLFALSQNAPCFGSFQGTGSQVVFSDDASIKRGDYSCVPNADSDNQPEFLQGESYVIQPAGILAAFAGTSTGGDWTLTVATSQNAQPITDATVLNSRRLISWGLTFGSLACPANQYAAGPSLVPGQAVCRACPTNSLPVGAGVNGINSCPCAPGYDSSVSGACTACPLNTYRALNTNARPFFQQRQGVSGCDLCHSSTTFIAANSAGQCGSNCDAGYQPVPGAACERCPVGTYKDQSNSAAACTSCSTAYGTAGAYTTASAGAVSNSSCICAEGADSTSRTGFCTLCLPGSFKTSSGPGPCTACEVNAISNAGANKCTCVAGYKEYAATTPSGFYCVKERTWQVTNGACSATCNGGTRINTVRCADADGNVFNETFCASSPRPPTVEACNLVPCASNGYVPQFSGGAVSSLIPWNNVVSRTITVPVPTGTADVVDSVSNNVAVQFDGSFGDFRLESLAMVLDHDGITVTLFQLDLNAVGCNGSFGSMTAATSLIFSDNAQLAQPICDSTHPFHLQSNEAYIFPPVGALSAFNGTRMSGTWQLSVYTRPSTAAVEPSFEQQQVRRFVSWGLTFNTTRCAANSFVPGGLMMSTVPRLNNPVCSVCANGADTTKATAGLTSLNNCPCGDSFYPQFFNNATVQCTVCPAHTYRSAAAYPTNNLINYNQQASAQCFPCNTGSGTATNPGFNCAGLENLAGYGKATADATPAVICSAGSYSAAADQTCTNCATGESTARAGAINATECVCAAGYGIDSAGNCNLCDVGNNMAKNNVSDSVCTVCPTNSKASVDGTRCICDATLVYMSIYGRTDGTDCMKIGDSVGGLQWYPTSAASDAEIGWGECSAPCGGGVQTRRINCTDASRTTLYSASICAAGAARFSMTPAGASSRACNVQSCTTSGYVPQYSSSALNAQIPVVQVAAGSLLTVPVVAYNNTIRISAEQNNGIVGMDGKLLAVHFTGSFDRNLQTLRIAITHLGVTSPLFALDSTCSSGVIYPYSQLTFVDFSGLEPVICSAIQYPLFRSHQGYVIPAYAPLAVFNGLPIAGDWTISVYATPITAPNLNLPARLVQNWGLTFNATICGPNQYTPFPNLGSGVCRSCPTNSIGVRGGVSSINSCPCLAGFDARVPEQCTICPYGTFRGLSSFSSPTFTQLQGVNGCKDLCCQPCNSGTVFGSSPTNGSVSVTQCDNNCNPGFTFQSTVDPTTGVNCVACPAGTFKSVSGQSACQPCPAGTYNDLTGQTACFACAGNATQTAAGSTSCTCNTNFYDYTTGNARRVNGTTCVPQRRWVVGSFGACSSRCEFGLQTRSVVCGDLFGNVYPDGQCTLALAGAKPITQQSCNTDIRCTPQAFIPIYASGFLNRTIPLNPSSISHTITLPAGLGVLSENNFPAIHFEASYYLFIQTLRINLCHAGVCVDLFSLDPSIPCLGSFGEQGNVNDKGAQIVFSDYSNLPPLLCSNANLLNFRAGETYVVPPTRALSAFYGRNATGDWTITITSLDMQFPYVISQQTKQSRYFISWGITLKPTICPVGSYLRTLYLNADVSQCSSCPTNSQAGPSTPYVAGVSGAVQSINSCPCAPGFDARNPYQCTACVENSYRQVTQYSPLAYQQKQGVSLCTDCHSTGNTAQGFRFAAQCSFQCVPGYYFNPAFGCIQCPLGTYKDTTGPQLCTACPAGSLTLRANSTSASDCLCAKGYDSVTRPGQCFPCLSGSYKDTIGAGECKLCAYQAVSERGSDKCTCVYNYGSTPATQYVNGSHCDYERFWSVSAWSDCDSSCENAQQTRTVSCTNIMGDVLPDSACSVAVDGQKPASQQKCPSQIACAGVNAFVPTEATGSNNAVSIDSAVSTVTTISLTTAQQATAQIIGNGADQNGITVFVTLKTSSATPVKLELSSNAGGSWITLLDSAACGPVGRHSGAVRVTDKQTVNDYVQLVFTDEASSNSALTCTVNGFAAGEVYAGRVNGDSVGNAIRTALAGLRHDGATYTLRVTVNANTGTHNLISFGVDYDTNTCPQGQFFVPTISGDIRPAGARGLTQWFSTCVQCPDATTIPGGSGAGFATAHLCECSSAAGVAADSTANFGYGCSICPANTYKGSNLQQVGVSNCFACNGPSTAGTSGSASCPNTCFPGYEPSTGFACSACANGFYKAGTNTAACTSCGGSMYGTNPTSAAVNSSQCVCNAGYNATVVSGTITCTACPVNTYKSVVGNNVFCLPCAYNATTSGATGQSSCSCINGDYTRYGRDATLDPAGEDCALKRSWEVIDGTCPSNACDGQIVKKTIVCRQTVTNAILPDEICTFAAQNPRPDDYLTCSTNPTPCVESNFYMPQVSSGRIDALIPVTNLTQPWGKGLTTLLDDGITTLESTIVAYPPTQWGAVISAANPLVVHVTALYAGRLDTLRVRLTHYGKSIDLFSLQPSPACTGTWGSNVGSTLTSAQVTFSDFATINFTDCNAAVKPTFYGGETYIIRPIQPLSAFYGLPVEGDYTLEVLSTNILETEISPRAILSWGVTVGPKQCSSSEFYQGGKFITSNVQYGSSFVSACVSCPGNSTLPVVASNTTVTHNSYTSCPCRAGFKVTPFAQALACEQCGYDTYNAFSSPFLQQRNNPVCESCYSTGNNVLGGTSRAQACPSSVCVAGRGLVSGVGCELCPVGFYAASSLCNPCSAVKTGSTTASSGANGDSTCVCPPGAKLSGTTCISCETNEFKSTYDILTTCSACTATKSFSINGTFPSSCTCAAGYRVLDSSCTAVDGSCCLLIPSWKVVSTGACSSTCDGGNRTVTWQCSDSASTVYTGAQESYCGPKPEEFQICNADVSCLPSTHAYVPRFGSGYLNVSIPYAPTTGSANTGIAASYAHTIVIPRSASNLTVSDSNQVAVLVNLAFPGSISGLKITITHAGVSVNLLNFGGQCFSSIGGSGAQIVFADQAGQQFFCTQGSRYVIQEGQSYIVPASSGFLNAFYGTPVTGAWTIQVWSITPVQSSIDLSRFFISWGLTFKPTVCLADQYIPVRINPTNAPTLDYGGCLLCPLNSYPIKGGVNSINSCPCRPGYDSRNEYQCSACANGFYRGVTDTILLPRHYQQQQGQASCLSCFGRTTANASTSASDCTGVCQAGYQGTAGGVCTPCPIGTFKPSDNSPAQCQACTTLFQNSSTVSTGSRFATDCACAAGYTRDAVSGACVPCGSGFFKATAGNGTCTACAGAYSRTVGTNDTRCVCISTAADYSSGTPNADGSGCAPLRTATRVNPSACDTRSTCQYGVKTYQLQCSDSTGIIAPSACASVPQPDLAESCTYSDAPDCPLVPTYNFMPEWGSGLQAQSMSTGSGFASTINIPSTVSGRVNTTNNQVAVHVSLTYMFYLQTLTVSLSHGGVTVTLFQTGSELCYGYIAGSEVIFADQASLPAPTCSNDKLVTMQEGESYIVMPRQALSAFNGLPVAGDWTLMLNITASSFTLPQAVLNTRYFETWGLTFNPQVCAAGQYLQPDQLKNGTNVCVPCPDFSASTGAGVNNINNCPCRAGYDTRVPYQCTACSPNTFRAQSAFSLPSFQQRQGFSNCTECHSSTKWNATASATGCEADCAAGFEPVYPSDVSVASPICRPCGLNKFKPTAGAAACTACERILPNSVGTRGYGATTNGTCVCAPGYNGTTGYNGPAEDGFVSASVRCTACPAGTFKHLTNFGDCERCAPNATSTIAATSCTCKPGFTDISVRIFGEYVRNGSYCYPTKFWRELTPFGACSARCFGGTQTRVVVCTDLTGTNYNDADCVDAGAKPVTERLCNTDACESWAYVPNWNSGLLNNASRAIPRLHDGLTLTHTIRVAENRTISAAYAPAVHVSAVYWGHLQTLKIVLSKDNIEVPLFALDPQSDCTNGSFAGNGAQAVFTDQATIPALVCQSSSVLVFQEAQSYVVKPASPLAAFHGISTDGNWKITLTAVETPSYVQPSIAANKRYLLSWGISFGPTRCLESQYTPLQNITSGVCRACPAGSMPAHGGVNGINSCPCAAGYTPTFDAVNGYQCVACTGGVATSSFYRTLPTNMEPYFAQPFGATRCTACNGATATSGSTSAQACTSDCDPGYEYIGSFPNGQCTPCRPGYTKATRGSVCTSCPPGTYMPRSGSTLLSCLPCIGSSVSGVAADRCTCPSGFFDYSTDKSANGTGCLTLKTWKVGTASACSSRCEPGYQTQPVSCSDATNAANVFADSFCLASNGPKPPTQLVCGQSLPLCTNYGYFPRVGSGSVDITLPIPPTQLRSGVPDNVTPTNLLRDVITISNSITVPEVNATLAPTTIHRKNQIAVHVTLQFSGHLDTLHLDLTHAGQTVRLFALPKVPCPTSGILGSSNRGAQLIFSDQSSTSNTTLQCSETNPLLFQQEHVYILPPHDQLAQLWGTPVAGNYTLTVTITTTPVPIPQPSINARSLISWGVTFNPTVCADNQYVPTQYLDAGRCGVCSLSSSRWNHAGVNQPCFCAAGSELVPQNAYPNNIPWLSTTCQPCQANFYRSSPGYGACQACSTNAQSAPGSTVCTCRPGFADYSAPGQRAADGSTCTAQRSWTVGGWSECSTSCEGGIQIRNVTCNVGTTQYPDISCGLASRPAATRVCNTEPCAKYGYVSQYTSSGVFLPIPTNNVLTNTITVESGRRGILSATNQVQVFFTASYLFYLQTLRVTVSHGGRSVELFNLGRNLCYGAFEGTGAQVVFSDQSNMPSLYCDNDNLLVFRQGQAYVVLPSEPLSKFYGLDASGTWTISVSALPNELFADPRDSVNSRRLISWGLTFGGSVCPANQYIYGTDPAVNRYANLTDACIACPQGSLLSAQGINTINSCPCAAGYDSSIPYRCTACGVGAFRALSQLSPANFQQRQNEVFCQQCFSTTPTATSTHSSQCSDQCQPGYFFVPGQACQPCPVGTFKSTTGPQQCTPCNSVLPFTSTLSVASTSQAQCVCARGAGGNSNTGCGACGIGSFKESAGNSACSVCASGATTTTTGATSCVCASGFVDYTTPKGGVAPTNGATCVAQRTFRGVAFNSLQCTGTCDGAVRRRQVVCSDSTLTPYDASFCAGQDLSAVPETEACSGTTKCIAGSYIPQYSAQAYYNNGLPASIPSSPSMYTNTITVTGRGNTTVSASNPVALHFSGYFQQALQSLQIRISHLGNSIDVFQLNPSVSCLNSGILGTGTQIVFSDFASVTAPTCDNDNVLVFQPGQPYVVQPHEALSFFYGMPMEGAWTISVTAVAVSDPLGSRQISNWGLTFGAGASAGVCGDNEYWVGDSLLSGSCAKCPSTMLPSTAGVNAQTSCGCGPGADTRNAGTCTACAAGQYKSTWQLGGCTTCASNAFSNTTNAAFCYCNNGFYDYSNTKPRSGSKCTRVRQWYVGAYSSCSVNCDGGVQTRSVYCSDPDVGGLYPDAHCANAGTKPVTTRRCNTEQCVAYGFTPMFSTSTRNASLATTPTFTDSFTITADEVARRGLNNVADAVNPMVHFSMVYPGLTHQVSITIRKKDVAGSVLATAQVFSIDPSCTGYGANFEAPGAQVTVTDQSPNAAPATGGFCNAGGVTFRANHGYAFRPSTGISGLANGQIAGEYLIDIFTGAASHPNGAILLSWGVSFNPSTCAIGSYVPPGNLTNTCVPCSARSTFIPSTGGFTTVNDCPCQSGYDMRLSTVAPFACTPCDASFYRDTAASPYQLSHQLTAGVSQCTACRAPTINNAVGSVSALNCSATCDAGFQTTIGGGACTPCPFGTYKSFSGAGFCTACNATFASATTLQLGSTSFGQCLCPAGYAQAASNGPCTQCAIGFYKPSAGIGSCVRCAQYASTNFAVDLRADFCTCITDYVDSGARAADGSSCVAAPSNANLASLNFSTGTFGPFAVRETVYTDYRLNVTSGVTSVTFTALPIVPATSRISYAYTGYTSQGAAPSFTNTGSSNIGAGGVAEFYNPLTVSLVDSGNNDMQYVELRITVSSVSKTNTYFINIYRPWNNTAVLGSLAVTQSANSAYPAGTTNYPVLSPPFDSRINSYTVLVQNDQTSIELSATALLSTTSLFVNSTYSTYGTDYVPYASGSPLVYTDLRAGVSQVFFRVRAQDLTTFNTYVVNIVRANTTIPLIGQLVVARPVAEVNTALYFQRFNHSLSNATGAAASRFPIWAASEVVPGTSTLITFGILMNPINAAILPPQQLATMIRNMQVAQLNAPNSGIPLFNPALASADIIATTPLVTLVPNDARIASVVPSVGALTPSFSPSLANYRLIVTSAVTQVNFNAIVTGHLSTVTWRAGPVASVGSLAFGSGPIVASLPNAGAEYEVHIRCTALDGITYRIYTIAVRRVSNVASLASIRLTPSSAFAGVIRGTSVDGQINNFNPGQLSYSGITLNMADPAQIFVQVTPSQVNAVVEAGPAGSWFRPVTPRADGALILEFSASAGYALPFGTTEIVVKVTAEDNFTVLRYSVFITRVNTVATLDNIRVYTANGADLTIDGGGGFDKSFTSDKGTYSITVPNSFSQIQFFPLRTDPNAVVTYSISTGINNVLIANNAPSAVVNLAGAPTSTVITVRVTAQDGITVNQYTLTVNRYSTNANLLALTSTTVALGFNPNTPNYAATVSPATRVFTFTPTSEALARISVTINNNLFDNSIVPNARPVSVALPGVGNTLITIRVVAADGTTTRTYTITVAQPTTSSALNSITGYPATVLNPTFNSNTFFYTIGIPASQLTETLTVAAADSNASVFVSVGANQPYTPFASGAAVTVETPAGTTVVRFRVVGVDGVSVTVYTVQLVK